MKCYVSNRSGKTHLATGFSIIIEWTMDSGMFSCHMITKFITSHEAISR